MKTAEDWDDASWKAGGWGTCEDRVSLIRAIQDDARGIGRRGAVIPLPIALAAPIDANEQLHLAADQMKVADRDPRGDITGFEIQSARDNATEHRRIAEAYIQLAQAMKQ